MRISGPIRVLFVLTILACLLALLLMPGATAVAVRSHASGKQYVRVISLLSMVILAASVCRGVLREANPQFHFRQVFVPTYGPDLLAKTCARLC